MRDQDPTAATPRTATDFERELENFNGSLTPYKNAFGLLYTEGIEHLIVESRGVIGKSGNTCNGAIWLVYFIAPPTILPARTNTIARGARLAVIIATG